VLFCNKQRLFTTLIKVFYIKLSDFITSSSNFERNICIINKAKTPIVYEIKYNIKGVKLVPLCIIYDIKPSIPKEKIVVKLKNNPSPP